MPCDCELDLERRWVRARAWGVVTYADALAGRKKFIERPRFSPDFRQLYDGRGSDANSHLRPARWVLAIDTVLVRGRGAPSLRRPTRPTA